MLVRHCGTGGCLGDVSLCFPSIENYQFIVSGGGNDLCSLRTLLEGKLWESGVMALAGTMVLYIVATNTPQFFPVASHAPPAVVQGLMIL